MKLWEHKIFHLFYIGQESNLYFGSISLNYYHWSKWFNVFRNQCYFKLRETFWYKIFFKSVFMKNIGLSNNLQNNVMDVELWMSFRKSYIFQVILPFGVLFFVPKKKEWICQRYFIIKIQGEVKSCTRTVAV